MIRRSLRALDRGAVEAELDPLSLTVAAYAGAVVLGLLALAGLEIWFYAVVYLAIGATVSLSASVYFSTITYAAIEFSDDSVRHPGVWSGQSKGSMAFFCWDGRSPFWLRSCRGSVTGSCLEAEANVVA